MSSSPSQPEVEDIVSAFESAQNQSWSEFSDKLGCIPIKDCKKKDIFKSENPIELTDEDFAVFGIVPRLEQLSLVSCNKCSMIVKSDCIHYHYNHRHKNPENDLFSVAQFIAPNLKTNKHKRPKLNVRKLPEKKTIDGVDIDPIVQEIKSEFDEDEFERISGLNRVTEQQGSKIQYDSASTSVNLALHCTPGTSYFNELCTQSLVQYQDPDQNDVNDQMTDYDEDLSKSADIVKDLQNNKCINDTDDSISEDIIHCITKVELNEKRKRKIDFTDCINDDEKYFENNHPKKKYHFFPCKKISREHSSLKTSNSCTDVIRNHKSDNDFNFYDQEVNDKVTDCGNNLNKLLGNSKELQTIDYKDDIDRNPMNYTTRTISPSSITDTNFKSFDINDKKELEINLTGVLNYHDPESINNSLLIKPYVTNITGNKCSDVKKNQNVDNFVTCDHLEDFKKADCDKNLKELLDEETKPKSNKYLNNILHHKMIYHDTNSEVSPIKQLDSSTKIKCTADCSDFIYDDEGYFKNNQDSINKNQHLPLKPHTYITSNSCSNVSSNISVENVTSCGAKVNDKINECNKDPNKLINDREKLCNNKGVNDNINEKIVNFFTVSNEPLDKLSLNLNNKRKHRKKSKGLDKNNKLFYKKLYPTHEHDYLPFESPECVSTIEYEEDEYKIDETNINSNILFYPIAAESYNDQKLKTFTPISQFIKDMDSQCSNDSGSSFHKPSISKHEKAENQMDKSKDTWKNIKLSIPFKSLDGEKLEKCIPIDKCVKAMDGPCAGDSLSNFDKSSTFEHKEIKDEMDEITANSKIVYLPSNDNISKIPICDVVKTMNNQCSKYSVPSLDKHPIVKNEKVEDKIFKINTNSEVIYFPLSPRLKYGEKLKKFVPIGKLVNSMEVQCSSNSIPGFQKSPFVKNEEIKDEMDKTSWNSNIIYLSLPPNSFIDENPKKYFPISEFVKAMDNQCTSDSVTDIPQFPSIKHEHIEDEMDKINMNTENLCLFSPSRSLIDIKPCIPISQCTKTMNNVCFSNSDDSFHKSFSDEHENVENKISKFSVNSNIIYFPFPPKLLNDDKPNKYETISKFIKETENLRSNNFGTGFHEPSNAEHKEIKDKKDKINVYSKLLYFPLPSKSLNDKKPKKFVLIRKFAKAIDDQYSNDSITTFNKFLISFQNVKENNKIPSNYMSPDNKSDGDENDKAKVKFYQLPSLPMNKNTKFKYLPSKYSEKVGSSNYNSTILSNNAKTKFEINNYIVVEKNKKPGGPDICYNYTSTVLQGFKNRSKSSLVNDIVVEDEYYCDQSYNAYYQGLNKYTLSKVLNPLLSIPKHFDSDIDTLSGKELGCKTHEILKNHYCSSSKFQSNEKPIKPTNAYSDIINNRSCDNTFTSCKKSSSSFVTKELRPLPMIDDSNVIIDNTLKHDYQSSHLLNSQAKAKCTPNKYSDVICDENCDASTSSYDQLSESLLSIKKRKLSLKEIFSDIMSDENFNYVTKLQESLMKNNKCTQTHGSFNHINRQKFIKPALWVVKPIAESHNTFDDKTKRSQTDLLFDRMDNNKTTKDLIYNYIPVNSNDEIVENVMNNSTSDISSNKISEYVTNSYTSTSVSSNAKNIKHTIAPTSIEECELTDNNNSDDYLHRFQKTLWSPKSHNDHFSNCSTHIVNDNYRRLHSYDKTCSPHADKIMQNECYFNHKTNESTSDVDKYFQMYKDRLKKTTDEKLINGKNWKIIRRNNVEAIIRKNTKKRLESKVVDNKENYGLWDLTESLRYDRTYDFVMRPALRQNHFSDDSD